MVFSCEMQCERLQTGHFDEIFLACCCAGQSLGLVQNWSQVDWNKVQYLLALGYTPWWQQPTPSASTISGLPYLSQTVFPLNTRQQGAQQLEIRCPVSRIHLFVSTQCADWPFLDRAAPNSPSPSSSPAQQSPALPSPSPSQVRLLLSTLINNVKGIHIHLQCCNSACNSEMDSRPEHAGSLHVEDFWWNLLRRIGSTI